MPATSIADSLAALLADAFDVDATDAPIDPVAIVKQAAVSAGLTQPAAQSMPEATQEQPHRRSSRRPYFRRPAPTNWRQVEAVTVIANDAARRIEIYFPAKPSEAVRATLKAKGWRFSGQHGYWFHALTGENLAMANSLK